MKEHHAWTLKKMLLEYKISNKNWDEIDNITKKPQI